MKKIFLITLTLALVGCFGEPKFDSTNKETIKASVDKLTKSLSPAETKELKKALMYFTTGGKQGIRSMMAAAFSGGQKVDQDSIMLRNIETINGLTAKQILQKYRVNLEEDRKQEELEAAAKAERLKVRNMEKEAEELLNSNKFKEAIAKYKELSSIPSAGTASETGLAKAQAAMEAFTLKMEYIKQIEITEFIAERIDTYSKKDIPAVRISLKNNGERSLNKVKVIVYFHDKEGKTIYEEDYHPVLVSKYSFSGDNKPLKGGYVKEMEKGKYYTIDSNLSEWQAGAATAKIVDIEFTK